MIYLIRTDKEERKTYLVELGTNRGLLKKPNKVGIVYSDFVLYPGVRDLSNEEVIKNKKSFATINIYSNEDMLNITLNKFRKKEIVALSKNFTYRENTKEIPLTTISRSDLLKRPEYQELESAGITHAYFLGEKSTLERVVCFEKNGEISGIVYSKSEKPDISSGLCGLALVLAKRIEEQEYLFEFMR